MKRSPLRRRTPLRSSSAKRRADRERRAEVRRAVFIRDGWTCQLPGGCDKRHYHPNPLTVHYLRKASAGGSYTPDNLISLCRWHNRWVEDQPLMALGLGLVHRTYHPVRPLYDWQRDERLAEAEAEAARKHHEQDTA